ncbi:MAG TPA: hypothetical protein ENI76_06305 [Ignavibacteria bacterium]|nr:hypothetical protein [Ignavibacteria bacterium]
MEFRFKGYKIQAEELRNGVRVRILNDSVILTGIIISGKTFRNTNLAEISRVMDDLISTI